MKEKYFKIFKYIFVSVILLFILVFDILIDFNYLNSYLEYYLILPLSIIGYIFISFELYIDLFHEFKEKNILNEALLTIIATLAAFGIGAYVEALAIALFFMIGEEFEHYAIHKSKKSIKSLLELKVDKVVRLNKDFKEEIIKPEEIKLHDILIIRPGEKIPVDGTIIEGNTYLNNSFLTGESKKQSATIGDNVLSGALNEDSVIKIIVEKTYKDSTINKMIELIEKAVKNKAKPEKFIKKFAKIYTPIVFILAIIVSVLPPLLSGDISNIDIWTERIKSGATLLVISCPCALVVSVPLAYFVSIGKASQYKAIIKGSTYLDKINKLDTIFLDKTGTITKGNFEISNVVAINTSKEHLIEIAKYAEFYSNHPISKAILKNKNEINESRISEYKEIKGKGIKTKFDDKILLAGNDNLLKENGINFEYIESPYTIIYIALDNNFLGYIEISDTLKDEVIETILEYKKQGIKVIMLTGDNEKVAKNIAKIANIDEYYSNLLPQDKANIIKKYKSKNKNTLFIGDGINDALSLLESDIGISMGALGSDIAIESSDIVLMDDNINKISFLRKLSKINKIIVIFNIIFSILVKITILIATIILTSLNINLENNLMLWLAIVADVGVLIICILNSLTIFFLKNKK